MRYLISKFPVHIFDGISLRLFFFFLFLVPVTRVSWKRKPSGLQVVCGFISVALLGMPIPLDIEIEE